MGGPTARSPDLLDCAPVGVRGSGPAPTGAMTAPTRRELYARARTLGITGRSKMNKGELAAALSTAEDVLAHAPSTHVGAVAGTLLVRHEATGSGWQPGMPALGAVPIKLAQEYLSPDSAPVGFAVRRSVWLAPMLLALAPLGAALLAPVFARLTGPYGRLLGTLARMDAPPPLEEGASVSFRPLLAYLGVLISLFAVGSWKQRVRMGAFLLGVYVPVIVLVDVMLAIAPPGWLPAPLSAVGGVIAAFSGLAVLVVALFTRCHLPAGVRVRTRRLVRHRRFPVLTACAAGAIAAVAGYTQVRQRYFADLSVRYLGGIDSAFVLFLLAVTCLLLLVSKRRRTRKPRHGPLLSVALVVPARNEAEQIAETIQAIDSAAGRAFGPCRVYVVDNGSVDATIQVASAALLACSHVTGVVLECPVPGKSHALNLGLAHAREDLIVRVDADTIVAPDVLEQIVPWFWDPEVGGVSGLPLPKRDVPRWLYPLRLIEVYYGVAFLRVAQSAANGAMVMPGLIAAYRRPTLVELGGFGEGFNGEDADMTMRIGRLGYRIVTDTRVRVATEVPATIAHLREQRMRWARGLYHMAGRNMSSIRMRQGVRGTLILPWSNFNAARRSMMIPIIISVLAVEVVEPSLFSLREVSTVAGFIVGLQLLIIAAILIAHRELRALAFVPLYVVFRLFRAYIAFETVFTLQLKEIVPWPARARRVVRRAAPAWAAVAAVALVPVLFDGRHPASLGTIVPAPEASQAPPGDGAGRARLSA